MLNSFTKTNHPASHSRIRAFSSRPRFWVWLFGLIILSSSILLGSWTLKEIQEQVRKDTQKSLETVLKTTKESLLMWVSDQKHQLEQIANHQRLVIATEAQLQIHESGENLHGIPHKNLREYFLQHEDKFGNAGFFIIAPDRTSIGSMRDSNLGTLNLIEQYRPELLKRAFDGETLMIPPIPSDVPVVEAELIGGIGLPPTMFFATPVRNKNGSVIAVLTQRVDPHADFTKLNHLGRIGSTGETYCFDRDGYLLTETRFLEDLRASNLIKEGEQGILAVSIRNPDGNLIEEFRSESNKKSLSLTPMSKSAIRGELSTNVTGYLDYRGVPVMGAWMWSDELGFGITTEIDVVEAMGSYYLARNIVVPVFAIMTSLALGILAFGVYAQEKIKHRETHLRATLNSIGDAVITTDINGDITRMNPIAERLTGWLLEEARGKPLSKVFHIINAHTREATDNPVEQVLTTGTIVELADHTILIARDDVEYQITDSAAPILDKTGITNGVVLVFRNVTEKYAMQKQLNHSSKMDAIGQLAGGVAHDFNNMLGAIIGAADLLMSKKKTSLDEESIRFLEIIIKASTRAADLTAKLLAFGRKGKVVSTALDIHHIIDDTVAILQRTVDKKISINVKKEADNHMVVGDGSELQNALINIGINASHAMSEGGELKIETKNVSLDKAYCNISLFDIEPGEYIEVEMRDTGCGIALDDLQKIFEPFYTTKIEGEGTGLGLSAVYGIVQDHHGLINVYSEVGEGTVFHIFLPCSDEFVVPRKIDTDIYNGSGNILLVDDEEIIRLTGQLMLKEMGYTVLTAKNGLEAVDTYSKQHAEIDIVIMDMIMPEMNGHDAFFKMKEINNNCKVLIASGFTKNKSMMDLKESGLAGFIRKPYRAHELSKLVAETIGI